MARRLSFPRWAVQLANAQGLSPVESLGIFRAAGGRTATGLWNRLWGEVEDAQAARAREINAPLTHRPTADYIRTMTTRKQSGFLQSIDIYIRDRATDTIRVEPWSFKTQDLKSRRSIIAEGISRWEIHAEEYEEDIIGAAYVSTYEMIPGVD